FSAGCSPRRAVCETLSPTVVVPRVDHWHDRPGNPTQEGMCMSHCRGGWLFVIFTLVSLSSVHGQTPRADAGRNAPAADEPSVPVVHQGEQNGWFVAESANFRLYHVQSRSLAEAALRTAERARAAQQRKWFGAVGDGWEPKCRICLYPSGESYSAA